MTENKLYRLINLNEPKIFVILAKILPFYSLLMKKLKVLFICCLIFSSCDSNNIDSTAKEKRPVKKEKVAEVTGDQLLNVKEKPKRNLKKSR